MLGSLLAAVLVTVTNTRRGADFGDRFGYAVARMVSLARRRRLLRRDLDAELGRRDHQRHECGALPAVLYAAFRSPRGRTRSPEDEERLRELLDRHGDRDSLGYFALRREKSVVWSPTGKAAVAYRVVGGVSLASGDPIGDPEAWPGAIEPWLAEAREHGWIPAVMGASEEAGTVYARHGLDALELGDEAIVETAEFTLDGPAMRTVRQAYNRVKRAGYTVRIRRHEDIPADEMAELLERADDWRDGATERGFCMALGRLGDPDDGRCVMLECTRRRGRAAGAAVLRAVGPARALARPDAARPRRRQRADGVHGDRTARSAPTRSAITQVSLNFAMFRSVFERGARLGAGPVLRLWRSLLSFFSRWWQIESLYRANAKYRPIWEPRFLLFEKSADCRASASPAPAPRGSSPRRVSPHCSAAVMSGEAVQGLPGQASAESRSGKG